MNVLRFLPTLLKAEYQRKNILNFVGKNKAISTVFYSLLILSPLICAKEKNNTNQNIDFSGFARLVVGKLNEKHAKYFNYDDNIDFKQQTLLGLQASYKFTPRISLTTQFIAQTGDQKESRVEWLYLTYSPTSDLQFKLGRQRTPFFNYSDTIDVGFAYPWINLPQQVYTSYFFSYFDGLLASYQWDHKYFTSSLEAYWGKFNDDIYIANQVVEADVDDFHGIIGNINYNNWALRTSFHEGSANVNLPQLSNFQAILNQQGFIESANSLKADGKASFYQISINYENIDYFLRSELTKVNADFLIVPDMESAFISIGYNFLSYVTYLTFAITDHKYGEPANEIPLGISPEIDVLGQGYQATFNNLPNDSSKSVSIGARWDFKTNLAFKTEITRILGKDNKRSFFDIKNNQAFDRKATLYQLAIEWVF